MDLRARGWRVLTPTFCSLFGLMALEIRLADTFQIQRRWLRSLRLNAPDSPNVSCAAKEDRSGRLGTLLLHNRQNVHIHQPSSPVVTKPWSPAAISPLRLVFSNSPRPFYNLRNLKQRSSCEQFGRQKDRTN